MANSQKKAGYYGIASVRASLVHFFLGKGVSASASLFIVITIIRELPIEQYAVYATLHAMVMMLRLLTSFGVNSAVLRFLPDQRVVGNNQSAYALLFFGIFLRALFYVVPVALLVVLAGDAIGNALKLSEFGWLLGWYLAVGFFRVLATFTVGSLESLLWQKQAQYSIAVSTLLRLAGLLYLISSGQFDLWSLVVLELVTEALSLAFLLVSGLVSWRRDPDRSQGSLHSLRENARRYTRFSFWAYLFNLTTMLHGSAPNRLIVSYFLGPASIALFGAVDRLINYVKQYEPAQLLMSLVRPVFNAQYRSTDDYPKIMSLADGIFRFNLIVLFLALLPCAVAGDVLFDVITKGKYPNAAGLFLGFSFVLVLGSFMLVLQLLVKAVELTQIFTTSNLVLSGSVVIALPFLPTVGLWALVYANAIGYMASIAIVVGYMGYKNFKIRMRWPFILSICASACLAVGIGIFAKLLGVGEIVAILLAYITYAGLLFLWKPWTGEEVAIGRQLIPRKLSRRAN